MPRIQTSVVETKLSEQCVHGLAVVWGREDMTVFADDVAGRPMAKTAAETDVLEIISDTVLLLDGQWRYVYINLAAEQIAGKSRDELIGRVIWETYPALIG